MTVALSNSFQNQFGFGIETAVATCILARTACIETYVSLCASNLAWMVSTTVWALLPLIEPTIVSMVGTGGRKMKSGNRVTTMLTP